MTNIISGPNIDTVKGFAFEFLTTEDYYSVGLAKDGWAESIIFMYVDQAVTINGIFTDWAKFNDVSLQPGWNTLTLSHTLPLPLEVNNATVDSSFKWRYFLND